MLSARLPGQLLRRFVATLAVVALLLSPSWLRQALAYTPPAISGHINDPGNLLTPPEQAMLNAKLDSHKKLYGHHIVVFLPTTLDDEPISDVAYATFNAWKIGAAGEDNGVLLVIASKERKARIETGKGVGGDLPDLRTNQILREKVTPNMKTGAVFLAVDEGTTGIIEALGGKASSGATKRVQPGGAYPFPTKPYGKAGPQSLPARCCSAAVVGVLLLIVIVGMTLLRRRRGGGGGGGGIFYGGGGGWGGGGGGNSGGGDSGGSDYSGGGGESGGGGSDDSW